jgi:DNA-binding NtrC family response regulator/serine/threonine protein kinase/tetratricopeptide (TPR) repeat protein
MRPVLPLRFETIQVLRETATSSTFVATDHLLARNNVVVKAIRKGNFTHDLEKVIDVFACFRGLRHPHIAGILDAGLTPKGDLFYVRDFAPASELFARKDMELLNVLLGAVDFLHSVGHVHGSIKPTNVLAASNSVQLADPWIPQSFKQPSAETEIRFSAPEVLKGGPRTIESDLYSVGALLYRFFSGRDLFDDADTETLINRHIWASPRPLTSISYVSRTIADIVEALIQKDPALRKPAFESLKSELRFQPVAATRAPAFGIAEPLAKAEQFLQPNPERLRVLVVEAPVGFGKTRFLEELRHRMAFTQPKLVFSTCPPISRSPYITVAQWILSLHDRHCSSFDDLSVKRLQAFVAGTQEPSRQQNTDRIVQDLVDTIGLIVQKSPIALLFDETDRANKKISSLVGAVIARALRLPTNLIVTVRHESLAVATLSAQASDLGSNFQHITVDALTPVAGAAMASHLETDSDRRPVAQEKAGGNPLFLEEYCKHPVPDISARVQRTLANLVDALPEETRHVAEVLSLFERPVHHLILSQVAQMPSTDLERHLSYLERIGLCDSTPSIRQGDGRTSLQSRIPGARATRLHALCYETLRNSETDKETLALHAYYGGLFEQASGLCLEAARLAYARRDYKTNIRFFELAEECCGKSSACLQPTPESTISVARSRAVLGDPAQARAMLRSLLELPTVQEQPELLSSIYEVSASPSIEPSNTDRIRFLNLAISVLPTSHSRLGRLYGTLAASLILPGRLNEAEIALDKAEKQGGVGPDYGADHIRGMIQYNRGDFRNAANTLMQSDFKVGNAAVLKTNLAITLEHLGRLREAEKLQTEALRDAESMGLPGIVLCLGNLGSMKTKLGLLNEAHSLFGKASQLEKASRGKVVIAGSIIYSDEAAHWVERGHYQKAIECLDQLKLAGSGSHHDSFQFLSPRCEISLAFGDFNTVASFLDESRAFGSHGGFFDIERLLIQIRLEKPSERVIKDLKRAVETSLTLETRYQQCRLLIALASISSALGDDDSARIAATNALDIAREHGYKLLAAHALIRKGLAERDNTQRLSGLMDCLQQASNMDLQPLLARCAFHIGLLHSSWGDYAAARDYFYRSFSTTTRMAEGLSAYNRKRFLSSPLHRETHQRLDDATARSREFLSALREPIGKDDLFFRGLYRLTSILRVTASPSSVVTTLIDSLKHCIPLTAVVVSHKGADITVHSTMENVPDGMKQRAIGALNRGDNRTSFGIVEREGGRGVAVWVPIPSFSMRAGIYIECPPRLAALDEQEIQFLTVAATVVAKTLDQTVDRRQETIVDSTDEFHGIVGSSHLMRRVFTEIEIAAHNSASVLIEGESGTGKEVVAKVIHAQSARSKGPFVPVDCGALPEGLIEAELFGARKGAFTGAAEDRPGLFESADCGTIFLDEISNASPALQTRLLRVLQEREVRRVGDTKGRSVDVRLIAATNRSLEALVKKGEFRQDLLFRLKVLHIQLPPLRTRREDIPLLATTFLKRLNTLNQTRKSFGADVLNDLALHDFPGNVRELQNVIERSFYASPEQMIATAVLQKANASGGDLEDEMEGWFRDLTDGRKSFWTAVHDSYKRRDISRERVLALVDLGLRSTQGNYKAVASMFKIREADYRRFMDFLRRNNCLLDFRPYRRAEIRPSDRKGAK